MIASALLLLALVGEPSAEVGVPLPADALATAPSEQITTETKAAEDRPALAFVPPPKPPALLVGRGAWLDQKFLLDPVIDANHGRPTVIFEVNDPALRP